MNTEDFDYEFSEMIDEMIDAGLLEKGTPAFGITQQVMVQGYNSLSPKQKEIFDIKVQPELKKIAEKRDVQRVIDSNPD